jgi:deoxycytidine triphosphate deaminase
MILTDTEIEELCRRGELISEGFDGTNLQGCAYEFRVSRFAYRYDYDRRSTIREDSESHVIYPFESVAIITLERVHLDATHYLQIHLKGTLFALGVIPVATAADPGFSNHLGLTLTNLSARPIELKVGERFAKGVFHRLSKPVKKMYTGQHGDATLTWPYPGHLHLAKFSVEDYSNEIRRFLPAPLASAIRFMSDVRGYLRWIVSVQVVALITFVLGVFSNQLFSTPLAKAAFDTLSVISGVSSIVGLLLAAMPLIKSRHER